MTLQFTERKGSTCKKKGAGAPAQKQEEKMKRRAELILAGLLTLFSCPSKGDELQLPLPKLKLNGGISATAFRESRTDRGTESSLKIEDLVLELSGSGNAGGFDVAVGTLLLPTVLESSQKENRGNFGLGNENDRFGLLWGYAKVKPSEKLEIDAGVLTTNVGYELPESYRNFNVTYGLVWNGQPFIYRGVRATYTVNRSLQVYGEYDRGEELNGNPKDHAFGVGAGGTLGVFYYTANYFDYGNYKNLVDISLSTECRDIKLGINGDYQWLDKESKKAGYGVALYAVPELGKFSLPVRLEYVKDRNNSGIYGFNGKGTYSVTVTPTYRLSDHAAIRTELSYVKSNYSKAFNGKSSKEILSFQISYAF